MWISTAFRFRWLPMGLVLLSVLGLSAQPLQRVSIDTWSSTTRYLAFAEFAAKGDGQIRITTGDRYTLYLNGDLIGTDDDPATVETYEVSFKRRTNNVAVVVEHQGGDTGYGLFCVLEAEDVLFVSSPSDRTTPWFWTGFPLENEEDAAWTKLKFNQLGRHEEDGQSVSWSPVQTGSLDPAEYAEFADLDLTRAHSVAGFPGGLDGSLGSLQLRSLVGQNAAFNALSADPKLVDGDINTSVSFRKGASALLQRVEIDLGDLLTINRVRVLTEPPSRGSFEDVSLRGYSILVSKDGVSFIEVGSRSRIDNFQESEVNFPAISVRHVRLVITEFSNRNASPRLGELEVFGEGVDQEGSFLSQPLDLGTDAPKNFDRVQWFGKMPAKTGLELRFRSGDDGVNWNEWTAWNGDSEIPLTVAEPSRLLQFQARMQTGQFLAGPMLDSLAFFFGTGSMPASSALASVAPVQVSIGVDTTFTYSLDLAVEEGDAGVARLVILTPWPAQLDAGDIQGLGEVKIDAGGTYATHDSLVIAFAPPLTEDVELKIPFTSRLLSTNHSFRGLLYPPDSGISLLVQEREGTDPLTERAYSLSAEAIDFAIPILAQVEAQPAVFSPNDDEINDHTVIGFTLARVFSAFVRVEIYDLSGVLVRTLPERRLASGFYGRMDGRRIDLPGRWDGRADSGERVTPGLYLYRVIVDLDPNDEIESGVVGVAY